MDSKRLLMMMDYEIESQEKIVPDMFDDKVVSVIVSLS